MPAPTRATTNRRSDLDEQSLRARCARLAAELPEQPAIRRIAFVGALRCEIGAADMDSVRMTHGLDYLLRSDVVVHPEFVVDVINLYHGRDFLAESGETDLVFVSFVPDVEHRLFARLDASLLEEQRAALASGDAARDPSFFWQARSSQHDAGTWRERAAASGALLVVTVGGRKEIGTRTFAGAEFEELVPTPAYECQPPYRGYTREQLYGVDWDVPYKWFGVLARREYLRRRRALGARPAETMLAEAMAGVAGGRG